MYNPVDSLSVILWQCDSSSFPQLLVKAVHLKKRFAGTLSLKQDAPFPNSSGNKEVVPLTMESYK